MGTDINAAIANGLGFPPPPLLPELIAPAVERSSPFIRAQWAWNEERSQKPTHWTVENVNGGPTVHIARDVALILTGIGWDDAANDRVLCDDIKSAILAIARFFKSPSAILMPDDVEPWFEIQESLLNGEWMLDKLIPHIAQLGQPGSDFASAIRDPPDYLVDGYLILKTESVKTIDADAKI
jgi:hypothetical protein